MFLTQFVIEQRRSLYRVSRLEAPTDLSGRRFAGMELSELE
jgi:hypothetical protein